MTFFSIPVQTNLPWYKFKISLSSIVYTLRLRYNTRTTLWMLDIADASDSTLVSAMPVLVARNMNGQYVVAGLPVGTFFCTDDTGDGSEPTQFTLGLDHTLFYADPTV